MTTEEKAKAYDEAIKRASKLRVQNPFDTVSQMMEHIFPELRESEDVGEGRCLAAKADALRQLTPLETPLSTAGRVWEDSMRNSVIYPSRELIEQMKRDYPTWRSQMLGGTHPSDWTSQDKAKEQ